MPRHGQVEAEPAQPSARGASEPPDSPEAPRHGVLRRIHLGTRRPSNWAKLVKFGLVGGSGYVVNLAVFAFLTQALDVHHLLAAVGAFLVAVTNNFIWNRLWTFHDSSGDSRVGAQAVRFFTVSVGGLIVNLLVLAVLVDGLDVAEVPSQAIAVAVAMPVNFVFNKMWTFGWAD
jgi:dolichol-phosphate mannosyltransferase